MNGDLFYRKARELLDLEIELRESHKEYDALTDEEILYDLTARLSRPEVQTKNLIAALVGLGVGAVSAVLWAILGDGRYLTLAFGLLCVLGVAASYLAFLNWRRNKADYATFSKKSKEVGARTAEMKKRIAASMEKRTALIGELNKLREENGALAGRYWWDTGIDPNSELQLPGDLSLLDENVAPNVRYELAHEVTVQEKDGRLYCENIYTHGIAYTPDIVNTLVSSDRMTVLYHNDEVIRQEKKGYSLLRLYAVVQNALGEIEANTKTVSRAAKKEQQMQEYRERLDRYERVYNGLFNSGGFITEEEATLLGRRTVGQYLQYSADRSFLERRKQASIDRQPDFEEVTTYRRVFNNFYWNRFVTCAYLLMPIDPALDGQAAMILMPLEDLPALEMTVRTASKEETYEGYLEEYRGKEAVCAPLIARQCISIVVDNLLNEEVKALLKIKPQNILEEKPKGLTDAEWVYLLWHGRA